MLSVEMADLVVAAPGSVLIERDDLQKAYSGILLLSNDYKKYTLGSCATIISVGYGVEGWQRGDRVLLAATAGRPIEFGEYRADRTLWKVNPTAIMLHLDVETDAKHLGSHPARSLSDEQLSGEVPMGRPEGDREGLR